MKTVFLNRTWHFGHVRNFFLILACCALTACGAVKLAYNNMDSFVVNWLDGYADLSSAQELLAKDKLANIKQWHRQTEVPQYVALLKQVQNKIAGKIEPADVLQLNADAMTRIRALALYMAPPLAELMSSITPTQIANIEKKLNEDNQKYRKDFLGGDVAERKKKRLKRTQERFEYWLGDLNSAQESAIKAALEATPDTSQTRMNERLRHQAEFIALLKRCVAERPNSATLQKWIADYLQNFDKPSDSVAREYEAFNQASARSTAQIINGVNASQKRKMQEKINEWVDDLQAIVVNK